ncbi:MAG: hydrogenase maturation nickel metallochaperone HypA [Candidatus Natronoplasma sp.]
MHEYSVMNQLVSALLEELAGRDIDRVKEVRIEVGEMTFLGHEQLKFAYETLSQDTILEGSELNIEEIKSKVKCDECGYEGDVDYSDKTSVHYQVPVISCPECASKPTIVKGKETKIVGVTAVEE